MSIQSEFYGRTQDGRDVYAYTLTNEEGMRAQILEYGCAIAQLWVPDRNGTLRDVVLGYDTMEGYEAGTASHGALVGRHANRIEGARFTLDGETFHLSANNGANHLHGTFSKMVFRGEIVENSLVLKATSPDGDDGFPGNVEVTVTYTLTDENALAMDYVATTDAPTLVNLTNHTYFNLEGRGSKSVLEHVMQLDANEFCEGNDEVCPTGRILPVTSDPAFDFTTPKTIGAGLAQGGEQLNLAGGFDHNFVLDKAEGELGRAAITTAPESGISMVTYTTQPGIQFYTANFLDSDTVPGKDGVTHCARMGFCLETQHYPCAPSHPEFPSVELRPDEEYHEITSYRFFVEK